MESLQNLHDSLDELLKNYLQLLEQYVQGQKSLQTHMSKGFFSLAQANKQSQWRRFGSDWYDERTKATVRASIVQTTGDHLSEAHATSIPTKFKIARMRSLQHATLDGDKDPKSSGDESLRQQPSPPPTPPTESSSVGPNQVDGSTSPDFEDAGELQTDVKDPILWFGVLTPAALRKAQKSFITAVCGSYDGEPEIAHDNSMASVLNAAKEMRALEYKIRRLRKAIKSAEKTEGFSKEERGGEAAFD